MVTAPRGGRRPSAASVSGGFSLFPPAGDGGGQQLFQHSLNPDSAFPPGFKPGRRRNSYAAGVPIPELFVQSPGGDMSPTLAQQLGPGHQGHQYGSQHFLDPHRASFRRRLPPTPLDLANGRASGSQEMLAAAEDGLIRRASSPRVLPTPPPQQLPPFSPSASAVQGQQQSTSPPCAWNGNSTSPQPLPHSPSPFERRRSVRRQLPPEPVLLQQQQKRSLEFEHQNYQSQLQQQQQKPAPHFEPIVVAKEPPSPIPNQQISKLAVANGNLLQRSSSTRSARSQSSRSANNSNLPPSPRQQQSLEVDNPIPPPPSAPPPPRLARTASAAVGFQQPRRSLTVAVAPTESLLVRQNGGGGDRHTSIGTTMPSATTITATSPTPTTTSNALTPPPPPLITASAPCSPRDQAAGGGTVPIRKFSTDTPSVLTDMAAISSLNLKRNGSGSMAHLLEQQHILRREFTATPATNGGSSSDGHGQLQSSNSNSSSLSPSIEQLNCTVASRSGSDAEIVADPSVLGFDPALYTNTNGASSTGGGGSHCSGSAHSIHSASLPAEPTTSGEERPRGLGLLHCTLQHFPVRKRLRVNVLKIEGLAGELRPDLEIQPFCKLTMTPGKRQQQQSVVKRGRDAVFNQEFFFDSVATEEIDQKQLQIEVCHSSSQKLQKDLDIGEVRIPLRDLTQQLLTKKEVRIVEELKLFSTSKKLGRLHISTCIEKEARRLTINLSKAEDLPKWGIVGAPDVQIRIKMQQSNGPEVIKSSRVLKNTTTAVYKEAVMFLIGTKEADLARTKITISVHDLSRSVTGNDVIGSVYLGELAMDKSELDQWRSTMDHWGKEYKGVHALKGPGQITPDVHVSDVQDEEGGGHSD